MKHDLSEALAQQWAAMVKFASDLTRELAEMTRRGQRGFRQNIAILESWLRAALLEMAGTIELAPARSRRPVSAVAATEPAAERRTPKLGFRAIEPDAIERQLASLRRPSFDISQFAGNGGARRDMRGLYLRRLEAIGAVLEAPEKYARRVKRKLLAREKRPPMKLRTVQHSSALPDLMRTSRHSDFGRYVRYNDTS